MIWLVVAFRHLGIQNIGRRYSEAAIGAGTGVALLSALDVGRGLIPKKEIALETEPMAKSIWVSLAQHETAPATKGDKRSAPFWKQYPFTNSTQHRLS